MFGSWSHKARRAVDPPQHVVVQMAYAFPSDRVDWGKGTPLWLRAAGLPISAEIPGHLTEWWQSSTGRWWARVEFTVRIDGVDIELDQLITATAIRPYDPATTDPATVWRKPATLNAGRGHDDGRSPGGRERPRH